MGSMGAVSAAGVATAAEQDAIAKHMHEASAGPISWKNWDTRVVLKDTSSSCTKKGVPYIQKDAKHWMNVG